MEKSKLKLVIWVVLPVLIIVVSLVSMVKSPSKPKTSSSTPKQSQMKSNSDNDHFNSQNLDLGGIPSDKYVRELSSELVNLTNDNDVETFKGNYKLSERASFQLPEQNSKLNTIIKFKDNYPSDMGKPSLHIDLDTLKGSHIEYLVTYRQGLNYKLVFDNKVLSNISNLS